MTLPVNCPSARQVDAIAIVFRILAEADRRESDRVFVITLEPMLVRTLYHLRVLLVDLQLVLAGDFDVDLDLLDREPVAHVAAGGYEIQLIDILRSIGLPDVGSIVLQASPEEQERRARREIRFQEMSVRQRNLNVLRRVVLGIVRREHGGCNRFGYRRKPLRFLPAQLALYGGAILRIGEDAAVYGGCVFFQLVQRIVVIGHVDIAFRHLERHSGGARLSGNDLHREVHARALIVVAVGRVRLVDGAHRVASNVETRQYHIVPYPLARHRDVVEAGHGQALDHIVGADKFFTGRRRSIGQLLAVGQLLYAGLAADLQLRGQDGEGELLGRVRVAIRPHALRGIAQLQNDLVIACSRAAVVGHHGVICGVGDVRRVMLAVVGHGREVGKLGCLFDHVERDDNVSSITVVEICIIRREVQLIRIGAHRVQTGIRDIPSEGSRHIALPFRIGRQLVRDVVQAGANRNVILQRPIEGHCRRGNCDIPFVRRCVEEIRTVVLVNIVIEYLATVINRHMGSARHVGILLDHIVHGVAVGSERVRGIVIDIVVPLIIALDEVASPVLLLAIGRRVFDANLRLHGQLRFGGGVLLVIFGPEHQLSGDPVVLALELGGRIRPLEGAGHLVAFGVNGLAVRGQLHIFQLRAPGEEPGFQITVLAASVAVVASIQRIRVVDRHIDEGQAELVDLQNDGILDGASGIAEIVSEGDGDLRGAGVAGVAGGQRLRKLHLHLKQAKIEIRLAGCVRNQRLLDHLLDVRRVELRDVAIDVVQLQRHLIRQVALCRREDVLDGHRQLPVGHIAALAHGAGGDDHLIGRLREARARPAREGVAAACGIAQRDVRALDVVGRGIRAGRRAASEVVADGVVDGRPVHGHDDLAGGAFGDNPCWRKGDIISNRRFRRGHNGKLIALAGGIHEFDPIILDGVGVGIGGIVHAAVQIVGDLVFQQLHARIQRHIALDDIALLLDLILLVQAGRSEIPAAERIAFRQRRDFPVQKVNRLANRFLMLHIPAVGHDEGHRRGLFPNGIDGHAFAGPEPAGHRIVVRILSIVVAIGREFPAQEPVAYDIRPHKIRQAAGRRPVKGEAGFFGCIVASVFLLKEILPIEPITAAVGIDVACRSLLSAEVHGDSYLPVGFQINVFGDHRVGRVIIVVSVRNVFSRYNPASESHAVQGGILRPLIPARLAIYHVDIVVHAPIVAVVEDHAVGRHALEIDCNVLIRHDEFDSLILEPFVQVQSIGAYNADTHVVVAGFRRSVNGDLLTGLYVTQIKRRAISAIDANAIGFNAPHQIDGKDSGHVYQILCDLVLRFASGDGHGIFFFVQSAVDGLAFAALQQDRMNRVIRKCGAIHSQRPAVRPVLVVEFLRLHRTVVGCHGEIQRVQYLGIVLAGHIQDIGDLSDHAVDMHRHIKGHGLVVAQILGNEAHLAGVVARIQTGGGIDPLESAIQLLIFSRSCNRIRLQTVLHIVQQLIVFAFVRQFATDHHHVVLLDHWGGAGDDEEQFGIRVDQLVLFGIIGCAGNRDRIIARQRDGGHPGLRSRLRILRIFEADGRVELLAGRVVDGIDLDRVLRQGHSRVLDGIVLTVLQGKAEVHAGLGVDGDQRLRDAVGLGIVGREHDPVDGLAVVRAHGNDGAIRPCEAALHVRTLRGRRAGEFHIREARIVFNVLAADGVFGGHVDGHGVLFDPQGDALAPGDDAAVVRVEGHGDLRGVGIGSFVLGRAAGQFGREAELVDKGRAGFIRRDLCHGGGLEVRDVAVILRVHDEGIRNGVQRRLQDVAGGLDGLPVGGVVAVADGAGGNHEIHNRIGQARAGPAEEQVACAGGIANRDVRVLDGVGGGNGLRQRAAARVDLEGEGQQLPVGGQSDVALVAHGDGDLAVDGFNSRGRPAEEPVALAGGVADHDHAAVIVVGGGVGGIVRAATQLVGDGVLLGPPARVEGHAVLRDKAREVDALVRLGRRRAVPAGEDVVLALRIRGNVGELLARVFQIHVVGLRVFFAIVDFVGYDGDLPPAGVEGHAAGEHVFLRLHGLAGAVRVGIPADEFVARIVGQGIFQRVLAQHLGGVGVAVIAGIVAGEDQFGVGQLQGLVYPVFDFDVHIPAAGDVGRLTLRVAEVNGDLHLPGRVQGSVLGDRLGEIEGFARAVGVVVPAREDQTVNKGRGRLVDGGVPLHIDAGEEIVSVAVVHEVHLVALRAVEGQLEIAVRHGEGELARLGGNGRIAVLHPCGVGDGAHARIALRQINGDGDLVAGGDRAHLAEVVG